MKYSLLFILVILFISASYAVRAVQYGGLGIFPNASEVSEKNPLTKAWFIYSLEPGEVKIGKVNVVNTSHEAVAARLYPVDAVTTADGAFAPEAEDKGRIGVGAWVSLEASELSIEPGETKTVDFTMRVPNDAKAGDHMGALIVQSKAPQEEMSGSGLRIATRVGARMYVTVRGEIAKELAFDEFTYVIEGGAATFYTAFSNKGNVSIRLKGVIEIEDFLGRSVGIAHIPEREVFPQKKIVIPVEWRLENLAEENLKARAIVTYDADQSLVRELVFFIPSLKKFFILAAVSSLGFGGSMSIVISVILVSALLFVARKRHDV